MASQSSRTPRPEVDWHFFSFPVAYGIASGALLGIILLIILGDLAITLAFFGFAFGTSHLIIHSLRRRSVRKRRDMAEEAEMERRALAARALRNAGQESAKLRKRRRR